MAETDEMPDYEARQVADPIDDKAHFKSKVFRLWGLLAKALEDEEEGVALARDMLDLAHGRNRMTLVFCLERLCPRPNKRPILLQLAEGRQDDDTEILDAARHGLAARGISPEEALQVARFIRARRQLVEPRGKGTLGPSGLSGAFGPDEPPVAVGKDDVGPASPNPATPAVSVSTKRRTCKKTCF